MRPHLLALVLLAGVFRAAAAETATAVATVMAGFVTSITVTFGGSGYEVEPGVTLSGGGGSGATARAFLTGDRVSAIVVLTAGSGYVEAPTVTLDAPPQLLGLQVEMVPKLTVSGTVGTLARLERAERVEGPWTPWTELRLGSTGKAVITDIEPSSTRRFYRAIKIPPPTIPPDFVWIPPGTFVMGSPESEPGRSSTEETQHTVLLTRGFWMCDHEVTQAEYAEIMGENPSFFSGESYLPVERVNWFDAVEYCRRRTQHERSVGLLSENEEYRLPTEAEWEYAARAGSIEARYGDIDAIAWWSGNAGAKTHPVRQKLPNAWGLYDMIGNVMEWCLDWHEELYPTGIVIDPLGPDRGVDRIRRGGGWNSSLWNSRVAFRNPADPDSRREWNGFRPVLAPVQGE